MNETNNQLPKDWRWVKLGEAVQVLDNLRKPINSSERQKRIIGKNRNQLFPYYGATGQVGWIDDFITDGEYVLVGEDGAPFLDNFKEKAYKINGKTWVNNHAHILQERKHVSINNFILHYLNAINYRQYVNGTTRLKLTKGSLVEIPFPLPPKPTQLAIVSKIEGLFSEIENGIKSLFTAQQQLKTYRQSVLKWAFEGKLTEMGKLSESGFTGLEDGQDERKNKKSRKSLHPENPDSYKGELPEGWKCIKFRELFAESPQNGLYKSSTEYGSGTRIIRIDGFYDGSILNDYQYKRVRLTDEEINRYLISVGDILINRVNSMPYLGKCGIVKQLKEKTVFESNIMKVRLNRKIALPEYVTMYLSSKKGVTELRKNAKQAVNQASINQTDVSNVMVPLPLIEEQNKIVEAIESRLSIADKMEESINQSLQQAEALKQSILKKAFEGRLIKEQSNPVKRTQAKIIPIERKILAGKIIHHLYNVGHFGLTKFQKILFVIENFAQVEYETSYARERAGPYDRDFTLPFRKEMAEKDWFREEPGIKMTHFVPGKNVGSLIVDYLNYFKSKAPKILFVLQQLKDKSLHESELVATLYAVWNNRIINRKSIKEDELINDFFNWSAEKRERFNEDEIRVMYKWMKKTKLIPVGFGKAIS